LCDCDHRQHVEAQVEALLAIINEDVTVNSWPYDVSKQIQSLKLWMACGFDGIPNECFRHLLRRPLVHLLHLFKHCLQLGDFPAPWKEVKIITLPKTGKDRKFVQNLHPISLLSTMGELRGLEL
jgi:hypothetical protein